MTNGRYESRKEWQSLYKTRKWHRLRRVQLNKEPLCCYCQIDGIVTAAAIVDHKKPHKGDEKLFFDESNLQSMCKPHHDSTKQREEKKGIVLGCREDGTPLDPNHHWNK